jgi:predicted dehydrogenase
VHALRVDGERGSLEVSDQEHIRVFDERQPDSERIEHVPPGDTFEREIGHSLGVIRGEVAPCSDGRSQRRALEVVLAAYRSMATGAPVEVR